MIEEASCLPYPLHLAASILVPFFMMFLLYQSGQEYGYFWQICGYKGLCHVGAGQAGVNVPNHVNSPQTNTSGGSPMNAWANLNETHRGPALG